ncbi:MAG TPA: DUF120 domain-containing protein [Nitrososphaerales archaeon]|nr:DUF120 domain-containing protein [Nitrososphaerales archaeon]
MSRPPSYLTTLIELYSYGASGRPVEVSTQDLGKGLHLSQQAASKHLLKLEQEGMIERKRKGRGATVVLTPKGADFVLSFYTKLKGVVEVPMTPLTFHGRVFTGLGEGGYYVSLDGYRRQFSSLLGFEPYAGTLNLSLDSSETELRRQLKFLNGVEIKGFQDGKRTYGPVKCFRAKVEGRYEAGALVIERTHHGEAVLEIISPLHLREVLSIKEGDRVSVTVYPNG